LIKDKGITGALEVVVIKKSGEKKCVHSKLGGDGDIMPKNVASVIIKIDSYLGK